MPNFASLLIGNKIFKDFSMDWINDLLWGEGIGHSILLLSFVIAAGIQLGKIKVFGISLGITLVLFVGIILGHLGFTVNHNVIHFFKEFGLILFVYSVGMQVGPGFFSSFRQGGITLNMLACGIVFLGVATALVLHFVTGIPMPTMVGILSGAVTNTPGLGAAQQAYSDMYGVSDNTIALGYAVAYPLGVIGIILSIIFVRYVFRVNFDKENDDLNKEDASHTNEAKPISLVVKNPAVFGKKIGGDILCNKKTYMLINALGRALPADRERLEQWLKKEEGTYVPEEKIAAVTALYNKMGIRALCDEKIRFYYERAREILDKVNLPEERKEPLWEMAQSLLNRKS